MRRGCSFKNELNALFTDIYLKAVNGEDTKDVPEISSLLRIGQLAKQSGETTATIRFWTKEGLLEISDTTASGYQLFAPSMLEQIEKIRDLQSQRYKIEEIKKLIKR